MKKETQEKIFVALFCAFTIGAMLIAEGRLEPPVQGFKSSRVQAVETTTLPLVETTTVRENDRAKVPYFGAVMFWPPKFITEAPGCDLPVKRVVDGDTFYSPTVTIVSPSNVFYPESRFRLLRVYAPERGQVGFLTATEILKRRIEGKLVQVEVDHKQRDPRGGFLVEVFLCESAGKVNVNDEMRAAGYTNQGRGVKR